METNKDDQVITSGKETRALIRELRNKYPYDSQATDRIRAEVTIPFGQHQIDRAEAEKRWKEIVLAHPWKPATPMGPQSPLTSAQASASHPSADVPKRVRRTTEKATQDASVPPAASRVRQAPPSADVSSSRPPTDATSGTKEPTPQPVGSETPDQSDTSAEAPKPAPELPPPPPKPAWKVLEPEERSDPTEHEVCDLVVRNKDWSLMAASMRGKLHAHRGLWRDDAYAYDWVDDWTIVAVSDGAGSAKISRVAARIACDESVKVLKGLVTGLRLASDEQGKPTENDLLRIRTFLTETAQRAQAAVLREAQTRKCALRDLNATLLLMLHVPLGKTDLVAAIQVGDGAVGIYTADGTCTLLGIADHGEYSSETRFLTTPNIEREFPKRVLFSLKQDIRCLAAMCDGVSDDFFPESKRLIDLFVGDPIPDMKTKDGQPVRGVMHDVIKNSQNGESLREWLTYEKKGSSDDRTLVLMYRSGS